MLHFNKLSVFCIVLLMLVSCKSQQIIVCEDVKSYTDIPWIKKVVEESGEKYGTGSLISIDKVTYYIEKSKTEGVGFQFNYDTADCIECGGSGISDCDGNNLVSYGGFTGCMGECSLKVIDRTTIYYNSYYK